ncbi:glycosyltransferase [Flavobacterium sp. F-380]|uniref:Glycosyltransferase n=1 Tax=Flavobacterium kayseriense TaxID=2764714 RepID=A0ABR7J7F5_9FLAO|nr:glycosyltransferase family 2 protein [Flavobacterium kayseriense]MBC5841441.1 glycosyltransferase [Flavobacterium kayseriense]MBC5847969.1 glycosyltransferase [Flavobacterium kayseriense]
MLKSLAIVIPYFKITFFEKTLDSLANQSDKSFHVYIGNDASEHNPLPLLAKYEGIFNFSYFYFRENLGSSSLVKQWNRCIDLTDKEEWLMILGDDDELGADCVAHFYDNLEEINLNKCKVVRFATKIYYDENQKKSNVYVHPKLELATDFLYRKITDRTRSSLSEYIFKKTAFEKFGFEDYNLGWYTDDRAWLEFSENLPIFSINSSIVSFRISNENISRANYRAKEKLEAKVSFYKFVIEHYFINFNKDQKKEFLLQYEQLVYGSNLVTMNFIILLSKLFLLNNGVIQSAKFLRRLLINILSNGK